jgi:hypothetical protein
MDMNFNMQNNQNNQNKSAKDYVDQVCGQLQNSKNCLDKALNSVEKSENRQKIQTALHAVDNALEATLNTLTNYQD